MTITFFDIPSKNPGEAWNPNALKARQALNYKGIKFETKWLNYYEIQQTLKELGVAPTSEMGGQPFWSCPTIYDSETGKYISNSIDIALYLDEKFPDTPLVFPPGTKAAIDLYDNFIMGNIMPAIGPVCMAPSNDRLIPKDQEYFRSTREKWFGKKLEDLVPKGPERDAAWAKFKDALNTLSGFYDKNGSGKIFFLGDKISYADFVITAFVSWAKAFNPEPELKWSEFETWNGGRWEKLLKETEKYRV